MEEIDSVNDKPALINKFFSLKHPSELAELLEITYGRLIYLCYRKEQATNYKTFSLTKKSGGYRKIACPTRPLKDLQQKLTHILQLIYKPKLAVHGFTLKKNIVTNAECHTNKRIILNIDLKDFFPSINFGRVRGLFISKPYSLPPEVASVIAQICCYDNQLPQGAPTSPIISNMVCLQLDSQLQRLAKKQHCMYTRYADDITFSTTAKTLPSSIVIINKLPTEAVSVIGTELNEIIRNCGFTINKEKVRVCYSHQRQMVTGLIVNKKTNPLRKYKSQIRAMLHAWSTYGFKAAQERHWEQYYTKQRRSLRRLPSVNRIVQGKLNFLSMVRGKDDPTYLKLSKKYRQLMSVSGKTYFTDPLDQIFASLWILECEETGAQGTAFMLEKYGLVTCAHVLRDATHAFQVSSLKDKYPITTKAINKDIDLAIIDIGFKLEHSLKGNMSQPEMSAEVKLLGFPNFHLGDTPRMARGHVTGFRTVSAIRRILISAPVIYGNSGGPLLNDKNEVVGIAVTGAETTEAGQFTENHGVIPVSALRHLVEDKA